MPVLLIKYADFGEVGIYNAAAQWSSVILFIPGALKNVIFSHLSSHSGDVLQQKKLLYRMLFFNFIATFIPFCVVWLFSGLIVSSYGESFQGLQSVLNISVFATIFTCMSSVYIKYLQVNNRVWITFWLNASGYILRILLFIYFMTHFENTNAALNLARVNVIVSCMYFFVFHVYHRFTIDKN